MSERGDMADPDTDEAGQPSGDEIEFEAEVEPGMEPVESIEAEPVVGPQRPSTRSRITGWVERRAHQVVSKIYESRADEIEHRARRAVGSAYKDQADDLEERAVRAMRRAITDEADRIKEVIEHAVQVKKREVRLSLLVLVVASVVYLSLYWLTNR